MTDTQSDDKKPLKNLQITEGRITKTFAFIEV